MPVIGLGKIYVGHAENTEAHIAELCAAITTSTSSAFPLGEDEAGTAQQHWQLVRSIEH